jgi:hypothetical protein
MTNITKKILINGSFGKSIIKKFKKPSNKERFKKSINNFFEGGKIIGNTITDNKRYCLRSEEGRKHFKDHSESTSLPFSIYLEEWEMDLLWEELLRYKEIYKEVNKKKDEVNKKKKRKIFLKKMFNYKEY